MAGQLPEGSELLYQRRVDKSTKAEHKTPIVVQKRSLLTGAELTRAEVSADPNATGNWQVAIEFSPEGARRFGEITEQNVGKQLAIILDGNVYSAPRINERIPGGRAVITGQFTVEEARDLAIVLRAGALPAPVQILEERTVGPSLGADSIRQGHHRHRGLRRHRVRLHAHLLPALGPHRRRGAGPQSPDPPGGHGRLRRDPDPARHRRHRPDHRHGGGHEHPHLRAHPRGAARRQDRARRRRGRVQPRLPDHHRHRTSPCW